MNDTYNNSHKISLFIAVLIPVLVISAVFFAIYFSSSKIKLNQDFLYAVYLEPTGTRYSYFDEYSMRHYKFSVKDGRLVKTIVKERNGAVELDPATGKEIQIDPVMPRLYVYKHLEKKSLEINEKDAMELSLVNSSQNTAGFSVSDTYVGGGFDLFGGGGDYGIYAVNENSKEKIDVKDGDINNFRFIAWIENK